MTRDEVKKKVSAFLSKHDIGYPQYDGSVAVPCDLIEAMVDDLLGFGSDLPPKRKGGVPNIPDPPPPPPKRSLDRDAKLDKILRLAAAIGGAIAGDPHETGHAELAQLVAKHYGLCIHCRGAGRREIPHDPADPHRNRIMEPCCECNGMGKATGGGASDAQR